METRLRDGIIRLNKYFTLSLFYFFTLGVAENLYQGQLDVHSIPALPNALQVALQGPANKKLETFIEQVNSIQPDSDFLFFNSIRETPVMPVFDNYIFKKFAKAIADSFKNGRAKIFLDALCNVIFDQSHFHCIPGTVNSMDFDFKVDVVAPAKLTGKYPRRSPRASPRTLSIPYSGASTPLYSNDDDDGSSHVSGKSHYKKGVRCPDYVVIDQSDEMPHMIIEIKSHHKFTAVHVGMAQLISFGLSVRHKKELNRPLHLIYIDSEIWIVAVLPPFREELKSTIQGYRFRIFDGNFEADLFLDKKKFFWLLRYLNEISQKDAKFTLPYEAKYFPSIKI